MHTKYAHRTVNHKTKIKHCELDSAIWKGELTWTSLNSLREKLITRIIDPTRRIYKKMLTRPRQTWPDRPEGRPHLWTSLDLTEVSSVWEVETKTWHRVWSHVNVGTYRIINVALLTRLSGRCSTLGIQLQTRCKPSPTRR